MGRLKTGLIGVILAGALPVTAMAQGPVTVISTPTSSDKPAEVGGIPTVDFIVLGSLGPGAPLRFGNVIPNSEQVQLNGVTLQQNVDYLMDYGVGVVYLKVSQSAGQSLTVTYRYKPGAQAAPGTQVTGLTGNSYVIAPGSLSLLTGFGVVERSANGSIATNNLLGMSDTFKLGQGITMSGIYMMGVRQQELDVPGLTMGPPQANQPYPLRGGESQMVVQDIKSSSFFGGTADVHYQSISRDFGAFNSLNGYNAATAARLNNERGLTRFGYDIDEARLGGFALSSSYNDVKDDQSGIYWRSLGVQNGGFNANWASQHVDSQFVRFRDLGEANRDQLGREVGMSRSASSVSWAKEFGKVSYNGTQITDDVTHTEIKREEWALNTSRVRFDLGDQSVDGGFTRFGSLMAPEQTLFGREAGIKRQWVGLQATLLGSNLPFSFNQTTLTSPVGEFTAQDASIGSKTWSLQHVDRNSGTGFVSMGAMSDAEADSNVRSIANMYGYNIKPSPNDRAEFLGNTGIDRQYNGFSTVALKGWNLSGSELDLYGLKDKGKVDAFTATSKNVILNYRKEDLGQRFGEINNMMDFERMRLGSLPGLDRQDIGVTVLEGTKKLDASNMTAETLTGSVARSMATYDDPNKLHLQVGTRSVSSGFEDGLSLVDPEAQLLQTLRGFNEEDIKAKWVIRPGTTLDMFDEMQNNPQTRQTWTTNNTILDSMPDKTTAFNFTDLEQHNNDPMSTVFSSIIDKMSVTKDMGKYGIIKLLEESDTFDGYHPSVWDQHRDFVAYQENISKNTVFKTEQTYTTYGDGSKEDIDSNTVSQQLNKRTGVSVTDTEVKRSGENEESHHNYGFWYDLGNGVKLSYGYAQPLTVDGKGDLTAQQFTLGKDPPPNQPQAGPQAGQVGNLMMNGGYYENQWNSTDRTQTNGKIAMTTVKPFKLGPIDDAKLNMNLDTGTDYSRTTHENKLFSGQGRYGTYLFGYEYKSQMDPTGNRAIDRTVKLQTDPSEKKLISAAVSYKGRTMPDDSTIIIRDYNLMIRPAKNVTLQNLLQTNPDIANAGALLGSVPQASRSDKWSLDYKTNPNVTVGGTFQELINDQTRSSSQTAGVTMKLFEKSGSPIMLFYGLEAADQTNLWRKTQRYSLQFDEKAGPNQTLSVFLGNISYEHSVPVGTGTSNNTIRLNYQYRF
jgi:hypothetical protein